MTSVLLIWSFQMTDRTQPENGFYFFLALSISQAAEIGKGYTTAVS